MSTLARVMGINIFATMGFLTTAQAGETRHPTDRGSGEVSFIK